MSQENDLLLFRFLLKILHIVLYIPSCFSALQRASIIYLCTYEEYLEMASDYCEVLSLRSLKVGTTLLCFTLDFVW